MRSPSTYIAFADHTAVHAGCSARDAAIRFGPQARTLPSRDIARTVV
jgi:hypothetical protein